MRVGKVLELRVFDPAAFALKTVPLSDVPIYFVTFIAASVLEGIKLSSGEADTRLAVLSMDSTKVELTIDITRGTKENAFRAEVVIRDTTIMHVKFALAANAATLLNGIHGFAFMDGDDIEIVYPSEQQKKNKLMN